jgi:hypothetical protein
VCDDEAVARGHGLDRLQQPRPDPETRPRRRRGPDDASDVVVHGLDGVRDVDRVPWVLVLAEPVGEAEEEGGVEAVSLGPAAGGRTGQGCRGGWACRWPCRTGRSRGPSAPRSPARRRAEAVAAAAVAMALAAAPPSLARSVCRVLVWPCSCGCVDASSPDFD